MSKDALSEFGTGLLKRLGYLLPALLLDPFDIYNRYIRDWLPGEQRAIDMPSEYFPWALCGLLISIAFLTYQELHTQSKRVLEKTQSESAPGVIPTARIVSYKPWTDERLEAIVGISGTGNVINSVRLEGEGSGTWNADPVPPMFESDWEARAVTGYREFPVVFNINYRFLGRCKVVLDVSGMEFKSKLEILMK